MHSKAIGSILMILGTTIGAAMLALPIVTSHENFLMSMLLLAASWLLMTIGAFSLLEVNLWLAPGSNMISMAGETLGHLGKIITWLLYLLLLYSLICAYLSGLSDILQNLLARVHLLLPRSVTTIMALFLFGSIVYGGISSIDVVNRFLMTFKLIAYFIIVALVANHIHLYYIFQGDFIWHNSAFMVVLTAFGYAIIIPSLRGYLNSDRALLTRVVLWGSFLPFIIYTLWVFVIQGIIQRTGASGLIHMLTSSHTNSLLMQSVGEQIHTHWVSVIARTFISVCAVTSFLGVSICLTDFIADGLGVRKTGKGAVLVFSVSYLPPLLIVLLAPGIFVLALSYAGLWCLLLLVLLPLLMLYSGRYVLKIKSLSAGHAMILPGGKLLLGTVVLFTAMLLVASFV